MQQVSFWHHIGNFLYSNAFVGFVALGVGIAAYRVYAKQKRDAKRDAANVVLLEIENAEQQIQKINETEHDNPVKPGLSLMNSASWEKHRYLFVRDFDRNEWDAVNDFYNKCAKFDVAVDYQESLFEKNMINIRSNLQRVLSEYADQHAKELVGKTLQQRTTLEKFYITQRGEFTQTYMNNDQDHMQLHYPIQPVTAAKDVLDSIETRLSLTSVGIKLKRMATKQSIWHRKK